MRTMLFLILMILVIAPMCMSATAYTDAAAFARAISSYGFTFTTNFDSQADGSAADKYGMMSISAEGLDSAGVLTKLSPIATNAYPANTAPNSLGVGGEDHQFLAGNSDRIVWGFSKPVHAFGIYLIGNPSPTGTPAIPFWKLHVNAGTGFDAYSATDPAKTIGPGNDVYFLGVVSADKPFTSATLYSDNDLAACFSFNLDNIIVAGDYGSVSIKQAKSLASGEVVLSNLVVARVHSGRFYVETADRSAGIAVLGAGAPPGTTVSVLGSVASTTDDERVVSLVHLVSGGSVTAPKPLAMGNLSAGGSGTVGLQVGCDGSVGPNNIGLDAAVWGKVTAVAADRTWITVDDGSGRMSGMGATGVKVTAPWTIMPPPPVGSYVIAKGSSSLHKVGTAHYPLIRVSSPYDVVSYQ